MTEVAFNYLFANCNIDWKIENFCFAYSLKKCTILSSEFTLQALKSVDWRLSLELENEKHSEETENEKSMEMTENEMLTEKSGCNPTSQSTLVSFHFEMLPTSLSKNVFVNWEISLMAGSKIFGPFQRTVEYGEWTKHGEIGIATVKEILDCLPPLKPDTIAIRFHFIAFDKDKFSIPSDDKPLGLFHLYKDLKLLKDMEDNNSDLTIKVKDAKIKVHKIILGCNERFNLYIEQAKDNVIEIEEFDLKTLNAIINFLYSREVRYCLEDLSISIIRCLEHFDCDALKPYYILEDLSMNSKIKTEKHEFHWYVPDLLDKQDFSIISPPIKRFDSNTTWHLTISMKASDPDKFISVLAEIARGDNPKYFCLEFALLSDSEKEYFPKRLIKNNESFENFKNLGFTDFVKKSDICECRHLAREDCVRFLFRVRTSDGMQECKLGCHGMSFTLPGKLKSLRQMSEKMLSFYKKEIYSDITIRCKDKLMKANKYILEARSPGFKQKIKNAYLKDNVNIWCIDYPLLQTCIKYIYTGILEEDSETVVALYNISGPGNLHIPGLYKDCEKYIRENSACYCTKRSIMY